MFLQERKFSTFCKMNRTQEQQLTFKTEGGNYQSVKRGDLRDEADESSTKISNSTSIEQTIAIVYFCVQC